MGATICSVPVPGKPDKPSHPDKFLDSRTVTQLPSQMDNHMNAVFAAMSDPTRRAVIERLTRGPSTVSDLHAPHAMALPTFLKHLRKLEDAGLVTSRKTGRVRTVMIEAAPLRTAEDWLSRQRSQWDSRLDRLDALATQMQRTTS